jgi:ribosomal protein S18 acetylase RimI-like enzyme
MEIYQASLEDLEEVSRLFNLYRIFYEQPSDRAGAEDFIEERLTQKDSVIFVIKEKVSYLGFTQLYPSFSSVSMKKTWILNDLFVAEEARKKGAGAMLMNKAREFAEETGAKSISLSTAFNNHSAQRLYERLGYKRDEQFFHYELTLK